MQRETGSRESGVKERRLKFEERDGFQPIESVRSCLCATFCLCVLWQLLFQLYLDLDK